MGPYDKMENAVANWKNPNYSLIKDKPTHIKKMLKLMRI